MKLFEQDQWKEYLSSFFGAKQASAALGAAQARMREPGAWFLGPRAENMPLLLSLVTEAVLRHAQYRTDYADEYGDPLVIDAEVKNSDAYMEAVNILRQRSRDLNEALAGSAPIASMRSHGHMLWDQVLPAMVGYFSGMLHNQNNVAAEASPVTTQMEIRVCEDLCKMLGYGSDTLIPWGHITCDGSVANIEALWAARNVKFYAVALHAAIAGSPALKEKLQNLEATLPDGSTRKFLTLEKWQLLNLEIDEVLDLPKRMSCKADVSEKELNEIVKPFALPQIGIVNFYQQYLGNENIKAPQAMVPASAHYSWPKAGTLLGLGQDAIIQIKLDHKVRMNVNDLKTQIERCKREKIPVIAVVAVLGTTEEGAVDPLDCILAYRHECRQDNFDFAIHCDAAWGGYFQCMRDPAFVGPTPELPMSDEVNKQYVVLKEADSITVDPHKSGYAPYPAGALCYRNSALRNMVSLVAPVVLHSDDEPSVGVFGIEGSAAGAAAAAVFLAHQVIPLNRSGYGRILRQCKFTSNRMYCRFLTMKERGDQEKNRKYQVEMLQLIPEKSGINDPRDLIKQFVALNNDELVERLDRRRVEMDFFKELGSDLNILAFAFNFFKENTLNKNVDAVNDFNQKIFKRCSITEPPKSDGKLPPLILTASQFDTNVHGLGTPECPNFVKQFADRLGVNICDGQSLRFLISTTMNPWTTVVPKQVNKKGDFLGVIEDELRDLVSDVVDEMP